MSVMDFLWKSLPPPPIAQAKPTAAQRTPWLSHLHPRLRGNVASLTLLHTILLNKGLRGTGVKGSFIEKSNSPQRTFAVIQSAKRSLALTTVGSANKTSRHLVLAHVRFILISLLSCIIIDIYLSIFRKFGMKTTPYSRPHLGTLQLSISNTANMVAVKKIVRRRNM
jgi:hypothetical protein